MGSNTIENKEERTGKDLRLARLFDLCKIDLGRVDCRMYANVHIFPVLHLMQMCIIVTILFKMVLLNL